MLEDTHHFLDVAAEQLDIPPSVLKKLKQANAEHIFKIKLDNGKTFEAFRVQHNNQRGPYKGGIRFHPQVNLDEIRTLATLMSLKTAAVGLPLGGGKGGVRVNPRELSPEELEELSRKYAAQLQPHIGPDQDIPAPDVNTNATIIDWMVDEYGRLTGDHSGTTFTGKSLEKGGSLGRDAATGRGGVLALEELLHLEKFKEQSLSFAVQGFGNVGSFFAGVAQQQRPKWRLVAASDSEAAVYRAAGLEAAALQAYKSKRGRFKDYGNGVDKLISNEELLGLDVDVLVLAGLEDAVTTENAANIRAKYIVEMANGPITQKAHDQLGANGHVILPDIIANAGGVIVSYLEWLQNKEHSHWSEETVNDRLAKYMKTAVNDSYHYAKIHQLSLKAAAFALALQKLTS